MQQQALSLMQFQKKFGGEGLSETFVSSAVAGGISVSPLPA